jgi:hypothetical protein
MHPHFELPARQILWTLTFAAQLVLLVVLVGRDRARRFPWFTAGIVIFALELMAEVLLAGRMAMIPLQETLLSLADLGVIFSLLVVVEVARRAFSAAPLSQWIVNSVGLLVVAGFLLVFWGPWPHATELALDTLLGKLHLMQLVALKGNMLVDILAIGLGLLIMIFGRHYKAGWRSHTQMISIGLSTAAISWLTSQAVVQSIVRTAHPQNKTEYEHVLNLITNLLNANKAVYVAVLVWWIVWLWLDEPGAAVANQTLAETSDTSK